MDRQLRAFRVDLVSFCCKGRRKYQYGADEGDEPQTMRHRHASSIF
jgi:hypothetical protein